MSNKMFIFIIERQRADERLKKSNKAICHWELSNIFVVSVANTQNMLMKTRNAEKVIS